MINEMLLITDPPSGNLILGDRTLKEIEEEKKQFNKMKLLEKRKETIRIIEEINSVQPMDEDLLKFMVSKVRGNSKIIDDYIFNGIKKENFAILLNHNPDYFEKMTDTEKEKADSVFHFLNQLFFISK